jgi:hypothetical protein
LIAVSDLALHGSIAEMTRVVLFDGAFAAVLVFGFAGLAHESVSLSISKELPFITLLLDSRLATGFLLSPGSHTHRELPGRRPGSRAGFASVALWTSMSRE